MPISVPKPPSPSKVKTAWEKDFTNYRILTNRLLRMMQDILNGETDAGAGVEEAKKIRDPAVQMLFGPRESLVQALSTLMGASIKLHAFDQDRTVHPDAAEETPALTEDDIRIMRRFLEGHG